jgi:hypothetical protein
VRLSGKNTAGSPLISERGLSERKTSGQEMVGNITDEGEIKDVAGEEVVMEDMDYENVKNKVSKPKKKVCERKST